MHRQALIASLPMTLPPKFHGDLRKMRRVTQDDKQRDPPRPAGGRMAGTRTPTLPFGAAAAS
jgi:conjugal transfer ATP-binding protein TraC